MKTLIAPLILATLFASASAYAFTAADQFGSAATAGFAQRTIVIDSHTRYVNVVHGETVTIENGPARITWYFDGIGTSFKLSRILPSADPAIQIYIAPELIG